MLLWIFNRRHGAGEHHRLMFAGDFNLEASHASEIKKGIEAQTEEEEILEPEKLVTQTNDSIRQYQAGLSKLSDGFQSSFKNNLVKFLLTSAKSFDKDSDKGLDEAEFNTYKDQMEQQIEGILEKYAAVQREQDAESNRAQERAADAVNSAEAIGEQRIEDATFEPENLDTPDGAMLELQKFDQQSGDLQKEAGELHIKMGTFQEKVGKFEEQKKSASSLISTKGLIANGLLFVPPGIALMPIVSYAMSDPAADALRRELAEVKQDVAQKMAKLEQKKQEIASYGEEMNGITDGLRDQAKKKYEEDSKNAETDQEGLDGKKTQAQEQLAELQKQKDDMKGTIDEAQQYKEQLIVQKESLAEAEKSKDLSREEITTLDGHIKGVLGQVNETLKREDLPPEQRKKLEEKQRELSLKEHTMIMARQEIAVGEDTIKMGHISIDDATNQLDSSTSVLEGHLADVVDPGIVNVQTSLAELEKVQGAFVENKESIDAGYESTLEGIDSLEQQVAVNVLDRTLGNEKVIVDVKTQAEQLQKIEITDQGLWESTVLSYGLGKVAEGVQWFSGAVFESGVWAGFEWVKGKLSTVHPSLGYALEAIALPITLPLGIAEAAVGMVGGIAHIVAHPGDAVKGLGAMIGRDPATGEYSWDMAGTAWGAMIGWEHLEKGQMGRGFGVAALNVLLTATGAGAAGTGAGAAAKAAGLAGRLATAGKLGKLGIYAKSVALRPGTFLKVAGKELGTGVGRGINSVGRGVRTLAKAPLTLSKKLVSLGKSSADDLSHAAAAPADDLANAAVATADDLANAATANAVTASADDLANAVDNAATSSEGGVKNAAKDAYEQSLEKHSVWDPLSPDPYYNYYYPPIRYTVATWQGAKAGTIQGIKNIPSYARAGYGKLSAGANKAINVTKDYVGNISKRVKREAAQNRLQGKWFPKTRAGANSLMRGVGNVTLIRPSAYVLRGGYRMTGRGLGRLKNGGSNMLNRKARNSQSAAVRQLRRERDALNTQLKTADAKTAPALQKQLADIDASIKSRVRISKNGRTKPAAAPAAVNTSNAVAGTPPPPVLKTRGTNAAPSNAVPLPRTRPVNNPNAVNGTPPAPATPKPKPVNNPSAVNSTPAAAPASAPAAAKNVAPVNSPAAKPTVANTPKVQPVLKPNPSLPRVPNTAKRNLNHLVKGNKIEKQIKQMTRNCDELQHRIFQLEYKKTPAAMDEIHSIQQQVIKQRKAIKRLDEQLYPRVEELADYLDSPESLINYLENAKDVVMNGDDTLLHYIVKDNKLCLENGQLIDITTPQMQKAFATYGNRYVTDFFKDKHVRKLPYDKKAQMFSGSGKDWDIYGYIPETDTVIMVDYSKPGNFMQVMTKEELLKANSNIPESVFALAS